MTVQRKDRQPLSLSPMTVAVATALAAAAVAVVGASGEVCLGDENVHVRHARVFMQTWRRPAFDPATVLPDGLDPHPLDGTPGWHGGLGLLWRLVGSPSERLAQVYQAAFYALLLGAVYWTVRPVWGEASATWAWLLTATLPMVIAYSLLLYQDVPGLAVSALALGLLVRRRYAASGLVWAAAYLTKMNMLSFLPWAGALAAWLSEGPWRRRARAAALVLVPGTIAWAWDLAWRLDVYGGLYWRPTYHNLEVLWPKMFYGLSARPKHYVAWKPFPFYSPRALLTHLGVAGTLAGLAAVRWAWDRHARWLWAGLALAAAGWYAVFVRVEGIQMRYLFPCVFLLMLLGGIALGRLRLPRWALGLLVLACAVQGAAAAWHVGRSRHIPPEEQAAFAWIREHTDPLQRILYPEEALTNQTGRRTVWTHLNPAYLLTAADDTVRRNMLHFFHVSHIAVPTRRTYNPEVEGAHVGGFPLAFVAEARTAPYLRVVYESPAFVIFRVVDEDVGPAP